MIVSTEKREAERERERERGENELTEGRERTLDEGNSARGGSCGNTTRPLGDEANMHALGPAKVHLDRIALHYAVLQRCSISYGQVKQVRERESERGGGNGTSW